MNFILNFVKGLFIGIGAIAPGVSGGSLAVIFGIYEKITGFIANIFKLKNLKDDFAFFFPIALGGCFGVLGFSKIMEFLFKHYNAEVKYLFIGLIAGTLPMVVKQANRKGFKKIYSLIFLLSLALTIYITALDNSTANAVQEGKTGLLMFIVYGAILGFGTIIPGISASFILMYLGVYETILGGLANINFQILIPTGIGFILSIVAFAKLIDLLFKKAYGYTYYTVLGFVVGSIIPVFPGFAFEIKYLVCVVLAIIGFLISFSLSKVNKTQASE